MVIGSGLTVKAEPLGLLGLVPCVCTRPHEVEVEEGRAEEQRAQHRQHGAAPCKVNIM